MTTDRKPRTTRPLSNELRTMHRLDVLLADLSDEERARVLAWLFTRYAPQQGFDLIQRRCNAPSME